MESSDKFIIVWEDAYNKNLISGFALDVFENEPYFGKYCKLKNVILTPHIGGYSKEIRFKMEQEALNKFDELLK